MLHAAVNTAIAASAVTLTVSGRFVYRPNASTSDSPPPPNDVIVVKQNVVSLYVVEEGPSGARMQLVTEMSLNAPPVSAVVLTPPKQSSSSSAPAAMHVDVLVLLIDDIHVSFLQFNPLLMRLDTVALVQLDDRHLVGNRTPKEKPIVRVDPSGRLLAVLSCRSSLYLIPVSFSGGANGEEVDEDAANEADQNSTAAGNGKTGESKKVADEEFDDGWSDEGDYDEENEEEKGSGIKEESAPASNAVHATPAPSTHVEFPVMSTSPVVIGSIHVFTIAEVVHASIHYIRDFHFVLYSGEPLLSVLYEKSPTWAGRAKVLEWRTKTVETHFLSCSVAWIEVSSAAGSVNTPKLLLVGDTDDIPYSATHLMPIKAVKRVPAGVVCFTSNALLHITRSRGYGAYINNYGKDEGEHRKPDSMVYQKAMWADSRQDTSDNLLRVNASFSGAQGVSLGTPFTLTSASNAGRGRDRSTMSFRGAAVEKTWSAAMSDETGEIFIVTEGTCTMFTAQFNTDGGVINGITFTMLGTACDPSGMCNVGSLRSQEIGAFGACVFVGSANGDSRLLKVQPNAEYARDKVKQLDTLFGTGPIVDMDVVDCSSPESFYEEHEVAPLAQEVAEISGTINARLDAHLPSPYADLLNSATLETMPRISLFEQRAVMDLVLCAGKGKSGALHVCRQSMRSKVERRETVNAVSVFFISGDSSDSKKRPRDATGGVDASTSAEKEHVRRSPSLLIAAGPTFTIVFMVRGESLQQIRDSALHTASRTVFACKLSHTNCVLQVSETDYRIVSGDTKKSVRVVPFDLSGSADELLPSSAKIENSTGSGDHKAESGKTKGEEQPPQPSSINLPLHACVNEEHDCLLILFSDNVLRQYSLSGESKYAAEVLTDVASFTLVDDHIFGVNGFSAGGKVEGLDGGVPPSKNTLLVIDRSQNMSLYALGQVLQVSGVEPLLSFPSFGLMPQHCVHGLTLAEEPVLTGIAAREKLPTVTHVEVFDFYRGAGSSAPKSPYSKSSIYLFAILSTGDLNVYNVLPQDVHGPVRLLKAHHHYLDQKTERDVIETIQQRQERKQRNALNEIGQLTVAMRACSHRIVPFEDVSGYTGAYVCGKRPVFFVNASDKSGTESRLRMYPHQVLTAVRGFSPFHSRSAPHGYVYCGEGFVDFATLNTQCTPSTDIPWLTRKVPLGATPHHVVYDPPSRGCFAVTSVEVPFRPKKASFDVQLLQHTDGENANAKLGITPEAREATLPTISPSEGIPVPTVARYSVQRLDSLTWKTTDTLELDENEQVLCAQMVELNTTSSGSRPGVAVTPDGARRNAGIFKSGRGRRTFSHTDGGGSSRHGAYSRGMRTSSHADDAGGEDDEDGDAQDSGNADDGWVVETAPVCAVATGYPLGEDVPCRGRLLLLTVRTSGNEKRIRVLHEEQVRGPVTALASIQGHVAAAIGATIKLFFYDWSIQKLVVRTFLHANIYVTRMTALREYLVFGDLYQSCAMARFSSVNHTLTVLARDKNDVSVVECGIMYHDKSFGVFVTDADRNLMVMGYTPRIQEESTLSSGGAGGGSADALNGVGTLPGMQRGAGGGGGGAAGGAGVDQSNSRRGDSSTAALQTGHVKRKVVESQLTVDGEYRVPGGSIAKVLRFSSVSTEKSCVGVYMTNYGEVGCIIPLPELSNRFAQFVVRRLQFDVEHPGGLTPRLFTGFTQDDPKNAIQGKERLVSASLLGLYANLDVKTQRVIAAAALTQQQRVNNIAAVIDEETHALF